MCFGDMDLERFTDFHEPLPKMQGSLGTSCAPVGGEVKQRCSELQEQPASLKHHTRIGGKPIDECWQGLNKEHRKPKGFHCLGAKQGASRAPSIFRVRLDNWLISRGGSRRRALAYHPKSSAFKMPTATASCSSPVAWVTPQMFPMRSIHTAALHEAWRPP